MRHFQTNHFKVISKGKKSKILLAKEFPIYTRNTSRIIQLCLINHCILCAFTPESWWQKKCILLICVYLVSVTVPYMCLKSLVGQVDGWVDEWIKRWRVGYMDGEQSLHKVFGTHIIALQHLNIPLNFWKCGSDFTPLYCHPSIIQKSYVQSLKWWIIESNLPTSARILCNILVRELFNCQSISRNPLFQGILSHFKKIIYFEILSNLQKSCWCNELASPSLCVSLVVNILPHMCAQSNI